MVGAPGAALLSAHHVRIIQPLFSNRDLQVRGYPSDLTRDLLRDLAERLRNSERAAGKFDTRQGLHRILATFKRQQEIAAGGEGFDRHERRGDHGRFRIPR